MKLHRVQAVLLQEFYHTRRSLEVIIDIFFFGIISILSFGFISKYLVGGGNQIVAHQLLSGMIFWEMIRTAQYSITVGAMFNIWSRNLSNMFTTPLTIIDYFAAHTLSALVKSLVMLALLGGIAFAFFQFNILDLGIVNLLLFFVNLMIFSFSTGIAILGLVFRFGTRIQALSWGIVFLFQPLTAVFYPLSVLPPALQKVALLFPPTYIFESVRSQLTGGIVDFSYIWIAFGLNIFYLGVAVIFFRYMYRKSRVTGQFARNEG